VRALRLPKRALSSTSREDLNGAIFPHGRPRGLPGSWVAQIIGIETREISSSKQTFYILKILDNGMKIMIPTKNAGPSSA